MNTTSLWRVPDLGPMTSPDWTHIYVLLSPLYTRCQYPEGELRILSEARTCVCTAQLMGVAALRVTVVVVVRASLRFSSSILLTPFNLEYSNNEWTLLRRHRRSNGLTSALGSRSLG